jgi:hypothetical protein
MATGTAVLSELSGIQMSMERNAKLAGNVMAMCIPSIKFHPKNIGIAGAI